MAYGWVKQVKCSVPSPIGLAWKEDEVLGWTQVYSFQFKSGLGQVQTFVVTTSRAYGQRRQGKGRRASPFTYQALFSDLDRAHRFES